MIIYFLYLLLCFIGFLSIMLYAAFNQTELRLSFEQNTKAEARRLWMIMKVLTDGQATKDLERELSCCGYFNALDYCDRKFRGLRHVRHWTQNHSHSGKIDTGNIDTFYETSSLLKMGIHIAYSHNLWRLLEFVGNFRFCWHGQGRTSVLPSHN